MANFLIAEDSFFIIRVPDAALKADAAFSQRLIFQRSFFDGPSRS